MIDLTKLAAPEFIERLNYDTIFKSYTDKFLSAFPAYVLRESDPVFFVLGSIAYRELIARQDFNDRIGQVLLALAVGSNLDHVGARYNVSRLVGEDDTRYRERIQLGFYQLTSAGTKKSYRFWSLSESLDVIDAKPFSSAPGKVDVIIFARQEIAKADATTQEIEAGGRLFTQPADSARAAILARSDSDMVAAIAARLYSDDVKPLTDDVHVSVASVRWYAVDATIVLSPSAVPTLTIAAAMESLQAFTKSAQKLGQHINRAAIIAALAVPGVDNVLLADPAIDVETAQNEIPLFSTININKAI